MRFRAYRHRALLQCCNIVRESEFLTGIINRWPLILFVFNANGISLIEIIKASNIIICFIFQVQEIIPEH